MNKIICVKIVNHDLWKKLYKFSNKNILKYSSIDILFQQFQKYLGQNVTQQGTTGQIFRYLKFGLFEENDFKLSHNSFFKCFEMLALANQVLYALLKNTAEMYNRKRNIWVINIGE